MKDTHSNNSYVELQIQICNLYLEIRGLGLQGVVACLASRKTVGFDSRKLHYENP